MILRANPPSRYTNAIMPRINKLAAYPLSRQGATSEVGGQGAEKGIFGAVWARYLSRVSAREEKSHVKQSERETTPPFNLCPIRHCCNRATKDIWPPAWSGRLGAVDAPGVCTRRALTSRWFTRILPHRPRQRWWKSSREKDRFEKALPRPSHQLPDAHSQLRSRGWIRDSSHS